MVYKQAVTDVRRADTGSARLNVATSWAGILSAADSPDPLLMLLGEPDFVDRDVSARCCTRRARRVLTRNGLTQLSRLMRMRVKELRRIPDCGPASLIDILAAALLSVVDDPATSPSDVLPLPGLSGNLNASAAPTTSTAPCEPVSDPLLDLLESR
jgi:hypothetical protein